MNLSVKCSVFRLMMLFSAIMDVQMQSFFDAPPPEYIGRTSMKGNTFEENQYSPAINNYIFCRLCKAVLR